MELFDEYKKILDGLREPPQNEAQTRWMILDRVLREVLGYEVHEVVPEEPGPVGNRPDYTILPNTPYTWLLEAKAYGVMLSDQHAVQATTYAYQNGHRWVVLSNGKEWRLYDSSVTGGDVSQRLVLVGDSENPEAMEALLEALHREVVKSGRIEEVIRKWLLRQRLAKSLQDPADECVKALCRVLKSQPWLERVSAEEVAAAMQALLGRTPSPAENTPSPSPAEDTPSPPAAEREIPVSQAQHKDFDGTTPTALILPNGQRVPIERWSDVFVTIVRYFIDSGVPIPLPWPQSIHQTKLWINDQPVNLDGSSMGPVEEMKCADRTLYVRRQDNPAVVKPSMRLSADLGVRSSAFKLVVR